MEPIPVTIQNFRFSPEIVEVVVGQGVVWTNFDPVSHSAVRHEAPAFDTSLLSAGQSSGEITFAEASPEEGFQYECGPHAFMRGTVKVIEDDSE